MSFERSLLLCFLFLLPVATGLAGASKPSMTFRIHVQLKENTGGGGQVLPIALSNPNQIITVSRSPNLAESHLQSVLATPDGGMIIQTTSTGARLLEEVTLSNPGKIMVVLLNGEVIYAPVIDMPLRTGRLLVPGPIPAELIAALQTQITKEKKR